MQTYNSTYIKKNLCKGECVDFYYRLSIILHSTLPIMKKKYAEILLCYRLLFVKGNIIIGEWGIFGLEISFVIADFH